ncbi:RdgB/HAM1 family non-canonical purine NTP pyrophosphatase [Parahaliea mediterranea]|uniref:RdgB/HAM1 family non-canonical purine NTP pyrophosphatase n=1 Tax=Parahaliea mediterranea TaxID=651086 RepID=UPI000E2FC9EB|nr:RdgB/HAM1 family non-canonical purine NTP pyrophosphatase [Parahaliea mediterranea]
MSTVILASGNAGKLKELDRILAPLGLSLRSQGEFNVPEVPEDGLTFVENALIKARAAARHTGFAAIADDSGLEVDALRGAPGIYSARYAASEADTWGQGDAGNNRKLLSALEGLPQSERSARFQCVLVYLRHADDPTPIICQGSWEGFVLPAPRGEQGFGYDPLFYVPGHDCSAAELPRDVKNRISHRGQACALLARALAQRGA